MKRLSQPLPDVFGECGMAGANLPNPKSVQQKQCAVDFLASCEIPDIVVATGPLTNIALAVQKNTCFVRHVKTLYLMGGCPFPEHIHGRMGNIQVKESSGWAEYNFAVDPDAAQIVFQAGFRRIVMVPLNVTRTILYRYAVDTALRESGTKVSNLAADILGTVGAEDRVDYKSEMQDDDDPVRAIHDVVAMAYLTDPDIFDTKILPIRIVNGSPPLPSGQTVIDAESPDHPAVTVVCDLDRNKFIERLIEYMR